MDSRAGRAGNSTSPKAQPTGFSFSELFGRGPATSLEGLTNFPLIEPPYLQRDFGELLLTSVDLDVGAPLIEGDREHSVWCEQLLDRFELGWKYPLVHLTPPFLRQPHGLYRGAAAVRLKN